MRRAALAVALALLAGCGGDDDPGGDPQAYRTDGDRICRDYQEAIAKLGQPDALSDLGPYIEKALPVLSRTVGQIERLDPPADQRDAYEAFRDQARQTVERAKALREAAADADADEVQRLLKDAATASERRKALAADAGLDACADI